MERKEQEEKEEEAEEAAEEEEGEEGEEEDIHSHSQLRILPKGRQNSLRPDRYLGESRDQ